MTHILIGALLVVVISVGTYQGEANVAKTETYSTQSPPQQTPNPAALPDRQVNQAIKQRDTPDDKREPAEQKSAANPLWRIPMERLVEPITLFTLGLFLVGVAQWSVLRRQARALTDQLRVTEKSVAAAKDSAKVARDALDESRRTNVLTLRAWMVIDDITFDWNPAFDPNPGIFVAGHIKNVGTLPAFNIQTLQQGLLLAPGTVPETSEDFGSPEGLVPGSYPMCGGGQSQPFDFPIKLQPADIMATVAAITTGASVLWLQMDLTYTDPIGSQGVTHNTMEYIASAEKFAFRRSFAS
jgi:hypothetical protein